MSLSLLTDLLELEHDAINTLLTNMSPAEFGIMMAANETIADRLYHMAEAEYRMASYLYKLKDEPHFKVPEKIDRESLHELFAIAKKRVILTFENLTYDNLDRVWTSSVSGNSYSYKYIIWHYLEHLASHRGQIAMKIRENRIE